MDKRIQSILKQDGRVPLQEDLLPDFPDDNTETVTVTKSRRVSFGGNFVKEFIVGSAVSTEFFSEYEQFFSSSDSSNPNSSRSGILDQSGLHKSEDSVLDLCLNKSGFNDENAPIKALRERNDENIKSNDENWEFNISNSSNIFEDRRLNTSSSKVGPKGKKPLQMIDTSSMKDQRVVDDKKSKQGKFSSTICFTADSPTADMEFTEGCISLAKSILDKKKKEMTVYIQAKPKEEEKERNETVYFDSTNLEMSITACNDSSFADESNVDASEIVPKPFELPSKMDISGLDSDEENIPPLPVNAYQGSDEEDDDDLERSLFQPERSLSDVLNSDPLRISFCEDGNDDMEMTDVDKPCLIRANEEITEKSHIRIENSTEIVKVVSKEVITVVETKSFTKEHFQPSIVCDYSSPEEDEDDEKINSMELEDEEVTQNFKPGDDFFPVAMSFTVPNENLLLDEEEPPNKDVDSSNATENFFPVAMNLTTRAEEDSFFCVSEDPLKLPSETSFTQEKMLCGAEKEMEIEQTLNSSRLEELEKMAGGATTENLDQIQGSTENESSDCTFKTEKEKPEVANAVEENEDKDEEVTGETHQLASTFSKTESTFTVEKEKLADESSRKSVLASTFTFETDKRSNVGNSILASTYTVENAPPEDEVETGKFQDSRSAVETAEVIESVETSKGKDSVLASTFTVETSEKKMEEGSAETEETVKESSAIEETAEEEEKEPEIALGTPVKMQEIQTEPSVTFDPMENFCSSRIMSEKLSFLLEKDLTPVVDKTGVAPVEEQSELVQAEDVNLMNLSKSFAISELGVPNLTEELNLDAGNERSVHEDSMSSKDVEVTIPSKRKFVRVPVDDSFASPLVKRPSSSKMHHGRESTEDDLTIKSILRGELAPEESLNSMLTLMKRTSISQSPITRSPHKRSRISDSFIANDTAEESDMSMTEFTASYPSQGDKKIIQFLTEQAEEPKCCWRINAFTYENDPSWSVSFPLLDCSADVTFDLKLPDNVCLMSFSSVLNSRIALNGDSKRKSVVQYAFNKLKKYLKAEARSLDTVRKLPFFLDEMNLYARKVNGLVEELVRILDEYPGSKISGSVVHFRLYSFPLLFSCGVAVDVSDPFRLSKESISLKFHFGSFSEDHIKTAFEDCFRSEHVLVDFVRKITADIVSLERRTGRITIRSHIRLLRD